MNGMFAMALPQVKLSVPVDCENFVKYLVYSLP